MTTDAFYYTYQDIKQIGKGGTGVIYRARHRNLDKYVVLKRITLNQGLGFVRHEVDILKNLRHRYLPTIYDFIEVDGTYYIVEDYIEGIDLTYYIKNKVAVPEGYVIKWMRQLCEVLDYLHTRNPAVIHSDIKPGNIMIDSNWDVCLIDFNISVLCGERVAVIGYSNFYCAPEQILKAKHPEKKISIDARTDIYSTCATFYTLLSGIVPKTDRKNKSLAAMDLPYREGLLRLIDKGMSPSPSERWQNAKQMHVQFAHLDRLTKRWQMLKKVLTWSAAAAIVFVSAGVVAGIYGSYHNRSNQYQTTVTVLFQRFDKEGATGDLCEDIELFLQDGSYDRFKKNDPIAQAQLYAVLAEYQSGIDNADARRNAANEYRNAWELIRESDADAEKKQEYAANYARALALTGQRAEAEAIVNTYIGSQNKVAASSINISIAYHDENYDEVLALAETIPDGNDHREDRIAVYKLVVSAAMKLNDSERMLRMLEKLTALKSPDLSDAIYRFAAISCFTQGFECADVSLLASARQYAEQIRNKTEQDHVNYAEILMEMQKYPESISALQQREIADSVLCVRKNCVLARSYVGLQQIATAKEYCIKAIRCYNELPQAKKNRVSVSTLDNMEMLKNSLNVSDEIQ